MNEIGMITSVYVDRGAKEVLVDVRTGPSKYFEAIRFMMPSAAMWHVPEQGEIVEVEDSGPRQTIARYPQKAPEFSMPDLGEGDFCLKLNEATKIQFTKLDDGSYEIALEADGDVTVNSGGNVTVNGNSITLGNEGGAESLAVQSHTHPYTWGDTAGSDNTGTPNEDGTQTTQAE